MRTLKKYKYVQFRDDTAGLFLKEDDKYYYFAYNHFCSAYIEKEFCKLINGYVNPSDTKYFIKRSVKPIHRFLAWVGSSHGKRQKKEKVTFYTIIGVCVGSFFHNFYRQYLIFGIPLFE